MKETSWLELSHMKQALELSMKLFLGSKQLEKKNDEDTSMYWLISFH